MRIEIKLEDISTSMDFSWESFFKDYFNNNIIHFSQKRGSDRTFEIKFEIDVSEIADEISILTKLSNIESDLISILFFSCPFVKITINMEDVFSIDPHLISFSNTLSTPLDIEKFSKIKNMIANAEINKEDCVFNIKSNLTLLSRTGDILNKYRLLYSVFEQLKVLLEIESLARLSTPTRTDARVLAEKVSLLLNYNAVNPEVFYNHPELIKDTGINFSKKLETAISNTESSEIVWENIIECMATVRHKINHGKMREFSNEQVNESYKILYRIIVELSLNFNQEK